MGLKETIQHGVDAAFSAVGNIAEEVLYKQYTRIRTYNATTGAVSATYSSAAPMMIFDTFKSKEIDGERVREGDVRAFASDTDLTLNPREGDEVVRTSGEVLRVLGLEIDPTGSLHTLHLRKKS